MTTDTNQSDLSGGATDCAPAPAADVLPEPAGLVYFEGGQYEQGWVSSQDAYTADQLRAAIAAERARTADTHAAYCHSQQQFHDAVAELSTLRQHLAEAHAAQPVPAPAVDERIADSDSGHVAAAPEQRGELPEPTAWLVCSVNGDGSLMVEHSTAWEQAANDHINDAINEHDIEDAATWVVRPAYTADQLRTAIAAERERVRIEHARELVEAHREAFVGNIEALSKLDLDAMNAQPLLMAVQNWDISTGRARELLRCWVLGTFKPDMLPECGDELFAEADEPRDAWAKLQAELSTLRQQLAEAVRDAKRYRWLRKHRPFILREFGFSESQIEHWSNAQNEAKIDAAIDAAIAAAGRQD